MWSFKFARIMGINIRVHLTFILFVAVAVLVNALQDGIAAAAIYMALVFCIFGFVLLHEFGHCLVARHYHIGVRDITLWPLGGVASMEGVPSDPDVEIRIALAGPLVNLALASLLSPIALATYLFSHSLFLFFVYLVVANAVLLLFNLLPAFPMDGGRVYRAWLARKFSFVEATRRAAKLGGNIAIAMFVLGIIYPWFFFIAFFIMIAGKEELAICEAHFRSARNNRFAPYGFFYYHGPQNAESMRDEFRRMQTWARNFFER